MSVFRRIVAVGEVASEGQQDIEPFLNEVHALDPSSLAPLDWDRLAHPVRAVHRQGRRRQDHRRQRESPSRSPTRAGGCCWSAPTRPPTSPTCSRPRPASSPRRHPGVLALDLMDLDPQAAADSLPRASASAPTAARSHAGELAALEEQLAGACTVEVAAFDAFTRLLADPTTTGRYDHVVFDTAPDRPHAAAAGAARRLVALPRRRHPEETTCLGPLAGLQRPAPGLRAPPSPCSPTRPRRRWCSSPAPTAAPSAEAARAAGELADARPHQPAARRQRRPRRPARRRPASPSPTPRRQQHALAHLPDRARRPAVARRAARRHRPRRRRRAPRARRGTADARRPRRERPSRRRARVRDVDGARRRRSRQRVPASPS